MMTEVMHKSRTDCIYSKTTNVQVLFDFRFKGQVQHTLFTWTWTAAATRQIFLKGLSG